MAKRAKKLPPAEAAPAGAPDPAPNSPEDLGYRTKGMDRDQLAEVERCMEGLAACKRELGRIEPEHKDLGQQIKGIRKRREAIVAQLVAIQAGDYQPGLSFDAPPDETDDGEGEE